jgi:small subunit ribosomal protein S6
MAQNYECALLLNPGLSDEEVQNWLTQFSKFITDRQGEVLQTQVWGKRRLEYPILRQKEAIFAFIYFRMEKSAGDLVVEFERQVRINDVLLREMTVQVPALKVCNPPTGDSRFSESARLAHAGGRRGGGARREYGPRPTAPAAADAVAATTTDAPVAETVVEEAPVVTEAPVAAVPAPETV